MMNNSILITGGTGSFGQALTEYLLDKEMANRIVIYSRGEHKQEEMKAKFKSDKLRFYIGDVRDKTRLNLAMRECYYIVHTAALKVVPTGENNPQEFIKTNILGTQNLIDCVLENDFPRRVIGLSTDKAVNPINLYGGTKFVMEKMLLASNNLVGHRDQKFSVVRYGNVANSNGSVIHIFKDYLRRGEPIPITHWEMTRFWIELQDAVKFVSDKLFFDMEPNKVFIPKMHSFAIRDLARAFHQGDKEFPHKIIGIREGEKLHEQIDATKFSNDPANDWYSWYDLCERLTQLGIIHDTI